MSIAAGCRVGPFEVVSPVGAGGMGEVWRARDPRIGRDVAIKVLRADLAENAERLRRFEQEAQTAGSLNHPNLITIFEFGSHERAPYFAMELLDGCTLREKLSISFMLSPTPGSRPPLSPRKAIDFAKQIASGLAAAHEKGIVHRDLKPENIFITKDGHAKILDFGIVKLASPLRDRDTQQTTLAQTSPGIVLGTLDYMSPEQLHGEAVDHRSDIFSLGVVLYEMLAGYRPFVGTTAVETMHAIAHDDPEPMPAGTVTPPLERIVRRCLEKEPRHRFHSAHDLMIALEAVGESTSGNFSAQTEKAWSGSTRRWMVALTVAMIVAAIAGAYALGRFTSHPGVRPVPTLVRLTGEPGWKGFPSFFPDGASFVYAAFKSPNALNKDIFVRRIGGENPTNLTSDSPADDDEPAVSPDGNLIAFFSSRDGGGIFLMGTTGESVRRLTDFGAEPVWSPDGKSILFDSTSTVVGDFAARRALWVVDIKTGTPRKLFEGFGTSRGSWSPAGDRIAFAAADAPNRSGLRLKTIPSSGGAAIDAGAFPLDGSPSAWTKSGLWYSAPAGGQFGIWLLPMNQKKGVVEGDPELLMQGTTDALGPSPKPDERRALFYAGESGTKLIRMDLDSSSNSLVGEPQTIMTSKIRTWIASNPSPDGKWLATSLQPGGDLLLVRTDNGEVRRLTHEGLEFDATSWAPDSGKIYFVTTPNGVKQLWSIHTDGSHREVVLTRLPDGDISNPLAAPDGHTMYVEGGKELKPYLLDSTKPEGQQHPTALPQLDSTMRFSAWAWSPDGKWLVGYGRNSSGQVEPSLYVYDVEQKTYEKLAQLEAISTCVWFADSKRIFVTDDRTFRVLDRSLRAEAPARPVPTGLMNLTMSPDGHHIFANIMLSERDIWMLDWEQASSAQVHTSSQP